jgi:DNA polymerase III subunit delta'
MALLDHFGQPAIRQQLDTILSGGRLPHALLFYGEPGSGILPGALSLANDILCTSPENGKACRSCPSCHRASKYIHPDLHFLLPLAGAKSLTEAYLEPWREAIAQNPWLNVFQWTQFCEVEGKQVDIHKEDIQHVTADLSLQSFEGGNKVLIIWMAQFLAKEGNRLLKMIEEPPEQTYFILITNQREQILPTIRSRCMQVYFPPMEQEEILKLLVDEYKIDRNNAPLIARQSVQDMGRALAVAHNTVMNFKDEMATWFRAIIGRKGHELATWSNKMGSQEKEEQKQFALYAIAFVRNILWAMSSKDHKEYPVEGSEMIKYLHQHYDPGAWHHVIQGLQSGHEKISRNANTKLLWLALSIHIKNQLTAYRLQHINS